MIKLTKNPGMTHNLFVNKNLPKHSENKRHKTCCFLAVLFHSRFKDKNTLEKNIMKFEKYPQLTKRKCWVLKGF